ncbi:MAG: hypothetical protein ACXQTS_01890 [Candidatus Methanospirareceae archaeon]
MLTRTQMEIRKLREIHYVAKSETVTTDATWYIASGEEVAITSLSVDGRVVVEGKLRVV